MLRCFSRSWLVLVAWSGMPAAMAVAQVQLESEKLGSKVELDRYDLGARGAFNQMLLGDKAVDSKTVELAAKYFIYRITWSDTVQRYPQILYAVRKEFESKVIEATRPPVLVKNKDFRKAFAKELIPCFKQIFDLPFDKNRIAFVNAYVMLPHLARLQQDQAVGDFLIGLLKDAKQHDVVRMHAARALGELFPARAWSIVDGPDNKELIDRKTQEIMRVNTLLEFIERKWDPKLEDVQAFHFIRREAIKTLAQAQVPAVEANGKAQKVQGAVAFALLRVLAPKPVMDPPPTLVEKLEAAVGLCQIKIDPNSLYQPEIGIQRVGNFLVEYCRAYQKDFALFVGGGKGTKAPSLPWRVQAERLKQALAGQVSNIKDSADPSKADALKAAKDLEKAAQDFLNAIKNHQALNNLQELASAIPRPKVTEVFRSIKEAPIGD